ncbi:hypothetical protein Neosp_008868 [[Neocosmospora] mangrovei]
MSHVCLHVFIRGLVWRVLGPNLTNVDALDCDPQEFLQDRHKTIESFLFLCLLVKSLGREMEQILQATAK